MAKEKLTEVGVVVGRFQVPELHKGHKSVIDFVLSRHKQVSIILGVPKTRSTPKNPMDFHTRYMMIKDAYKSSTNLTISAIMDIRDDVEWSRKLDEKLEEMYHGKSITLYGSRDSFIRHYSGKHKTQELESDILISGSMIREEIKDQVISTPEFRAGVVYAANDRFFNAIPTVDVALVDIKKESKRILLGRKKDEKNFRLIGGFVDAKDSSYEDAATRELREEAGVNVEIGDMRYVMSWKIDDWRYKDQQAKIITNLYVTELRWGSPRPGDDIYELQWFDMATLKKSDVMEEHHILVRKVLERYSVAFDQEELAI